MEIVQSMAMSAYADCNEVTQVRTPSLFRHYYYSYSIERLKVELGLQTQGKPNRCVEMWRLAPSDE